MYTDADLDAAITGGAMTPEAVAAFRSFMTIRRAGPAADEESFRFLTGFNDVFVTIAVVLVLLALNWLVPFGASVAPAVTAAASWGLAEYFTRQRRMALPSIVLLLTFVSSVTIGAAILGGVVAGSDMGPSEWGLGAVTCFATLAGAAAAYGHWRRFRVPITVAVGTLAAAASILSAAAWAFPSQPDLHGAIFLGTGLGIFAVAMWWDSKDRLRLTGRSDAAFWLHLTAAPLIVHPIFAGLGLLTASVPPVNALVAVGCYLVLAVVALTVDRRAILVSSLVYVLWAMQSLLAGIGTLSTAFAISALAIGSCLLLLSAFWQHTRRGILRWVPRGVRDRVPPA